VQTVATEVFTDDEIKAVRKLRTMYGSTNWNNTGYFAVPGVVMRGLVERGYAKTRKRGPSAPAEYQGKFNSPIKAEYP
jgi:hypothetical protein